MIDKGNGLGLKILIGGKTSGFLRMVLPKLGISAAFVIVGLSSGGGVVTASLLSFFLSMSGNENFCSGALHLLYWASGLLLHTQLGGYCFPMLEELVGSNLHLRHISIKKLTLLHRTHGFLTFPV